MILASLCFFPLHLWWFSSHRMSNFKHGIVLWYGCLKLFLFWNIFLWKLVGGQFDLEMNFIIQEAEGITCMVDLLDKCDITCQAEVWSMFTAILKKSIRNLQACTEVGLVEQVLRRIDRADNMIAGTAPPSVGLKLCCFYAKSHGHSY